MEKYLIFIDSIINIFCYKTDSQSPRFAANPSSVSINHACYFPSVQYLAIMLLLNSDVVAPIELQNR